jgi:hypothetical protein
MATIAVDSTTREMNGMVEVKLDVRTSMGKIIVPFKFADQGSSAANEKHAYAELRVWLQEALQALEALESAVKKPI